MKVTSKKATTSSTQKQENGVTSSSTELKYTYCDSATEDAQKALILLKTEIEELKNLVKLLLDKVK